MPDGYRRGGQVTRNGRTFHRRGTSIARPSGLAVAAGIGVVGAALFGAGSAAALTVGVVGVGALVGYRFRRPIGRALRPVGRRLERWANRRSRGRGGGHTTTAYDPHGTGLAVTVTKWRAARRTRPPRPPRPRFDIFDPVDGETIRTVRTERAARRITGRQKGLDYCLEGEGWT